MNFITNPVTWWVDPFADYEFMRNALLAGLLTAVLCALVGTWVVLRGMTFLGDALAHGVLPGIALAFVVGWSTTLGAFVAAGAMVAGVYLMQARSPLPVDTSIGVLFVGFLALAVVIVSSSAVGYAGDLSRFLFGSVTGVDNGDLIRISVALVAVVIVSLIFYRAFLVMTFDENLARVLGLRPRLANGVQLAMLAGAVVASFEVVGGLLVFAYLVAPAAAAVMVVRRVPMIIFVASVIGSLSVLVGLLLSYHNDLAAGATMALLTVVAYLLASVVRMVMPAMGSGSR